MDLALDPEMQRFVEEQVVSGRYASAEEVVSASLVLLANFEKERSTFDAELGRRIADLDRGETISADELREHFRRRGGTFQARRHVNAA